jgi:predicted O-linked N-acetylglucosamine transferase (SPINDLY family)
LQEAEASYRQVLQLEPDAAIAHYNLGTILNDLGRLDEAETSYRRALQIEPDSAITHNNLGLTLTDLGRLEEAAASYRQALQIQPDHAEAYSNLGNTLNDLGRLEESEASYRQALRTKPGYAEAHSNLLFTLNYNAGQRPDEYLAEARRYGEAVSEKVKAPFERWSCAVPGERLRVGLVSGDFINHPVGYFLESLVGQLDPTLIELIGYPTNPRSDALTARIRPHFGGWKPLYGKSDEAAAELIHGDGIHILIDLAGHTAHNRLPVFAWKPAPVQVSWLGYFASTGVTEIDYLIADPWTLPAGDEGQFTETIWRLPDSRLCFTAPALEIDVGPLPALANGHITFGCFNNLTKMNDAVVALWSRVLKAVPGSRLYLKAKQLKEGTVRQSTVARFAAHGIAAVRLILEGLSPRADYLASYHRVDIALDPFPYTGGTTSAEGLWMGVPVLTLAGERFLSRQGVGLLKNAGLEQWIAADGDDYVAKAVAHANDTVGLAALRGRLRPQVLESPLFDAPRLARHFESALCDMWQAWTCARIANAHLDDQYEHQNRDLEDT